MRDLTALVGANGSGKSSFLKALDLFYSTSQKLSAEDFYNGDTKKNIQITVTFCSLDDSEKRHFKKYLQNNELSVVRVLSLEEGKLSDKYHGSTLQCPDFVDVRRVGGATWRGWCCSSPITIASRRAGTRCCSSRFRPPIS